MARSNFHQLWDATAVFASEQVPRQHLKRLAGYTIVTLNSTGRIAEVFMVADADYLKYVTELLAPLGGITSRAMFGGYGIFHEEAMFALIAGSTLFFKVDDSNRAAYEHAGSRQFKPMPYWEVPADILENTADLHEWASLSIVIEKDAHSRKKRL